MLTNLPFLEMVASENRHTYISTGGSSMSDINKAVAIFKSKRCGFTLLHAVSQYNIPFVNLEEYLEESRVADILRRIGEVLSPIIPGIISKIRSLF